MKYNKIEYEVIVSGGGLVVDCLIVSVLVVVGGNVVGDLIVCELVVGELIVGERVVGVGGLVVGVLPIVPICEAIHGIPTMPWGAVDDTHHTMGTWSHPPSQGCCDC